MKDECFPVNQLLNLRTERSGKQCLKEAKSVLILRCRMGGDKRSNSLFKLDVFFIKSILLHVITYHQQDLNPSFWKEGSRL